MRSPTLPRPRMLSGLMSEVRSGEVRIGGRQRQAVGSGSVCSSVRVALPHAAVARSTHHVGLSSTRSTRSAETRASTSAGRPLAAVPAA